MKMGTKRSFFKTCYVSLLKHYRKEPKKNTHTHTERERERKLWSEVVATTKDAVFPHDRPLPPLHARSDRHPETNHVKSSTPPRFSPDHHFPSNSNAYNCAAALPVLTKFCARRPCHMIYCRELESKNVHSFSFHPLGII